MSTAKMSTANVSTAKTLHLLYFASLAEQSGKDEEQLQFVGTSLSELYEQLSEQYAFDLTQDELAVAINHQMGDWHTPITHGDIIAFIPPVAGG